MDYNDDIRLPDPIKKEKLIENDFDEEYINPIWSSEDEELNKIIELSKNEYNLFQNEQDKIVIQETTKQHSLKFDSIKNKLNKILIFDKINSTKYENILSIITLYEEGYINKYNSTKEEINGLLNLLKTIRLTKEELESIIDLFVYEE